MRNFILDPVWQAAVDAVRPPPAVAAAATPLMPSYYASQLTYVDDAAGAAAMLQLAEELPLSHIGIDTEFGFHRPPVDLPNGQTATDPRSVKPLLLSLTLVKTPASTDHDAAAMYEFVIDLRAGQVLPALHDLLGLPTTFVGHYLHAEYICLRAAGLRGPTPGWDTWVAEKVRHLGLHHVRYKTAATADEFAEAKAKEDAEREELLRMDLRSTCSRHRVEHPFAEAEKKRLQESFFNHPDGEPFTEEQRRYAASDATAAARLNVPQVVAAALTGTLSHLIKVEMPWVKPNAEMAWTGVRVDADARSRLRDACGSKLAVLNAELKTAGIDSQRSRPQLIKVFREKGLLEAFRRGNSYSFNKAGLRRCVTSIRPLRWSTKLARSSGSVKARSSILPLSATTGGSTPSTRCTAGVPQASHLPHRTIGCDV